MKIETKNIYNLSICYLLLPIIMFFCNWLKPIVAAFILIVVLYSAFFFIKHIAKNISGFIIVDNCLLLAMLLLLCFLLSTGTGAIIGTNAWDVPWRNAIYNDLIQKPWPVFYDNSALVYYITFWLIPAGISSLLDLSWQASQLLLFAWIYLGLILIFLLLCDYLKLEKNEKLFVAVTFICWSGVNIIGMLLKSAYGAPALTIDDYPGFSSWEVNRMGFFLRTVYDSFANVYNQYPSTIISFLFFLRFRDQVKYYALFGLLVLPYSPFGFIGLFSILIAMGFYYSSYNIKETRLKNLLKEIFSIANIGASISIGLVFSLYYLSNNVAGQAGEVYQVGKLFTVSGLGKLLLYYILTFGLYLYLVYDDYKCDFLYIVNLVVLVIFPFIKIGAGGDFNWNGCSGPFFIVYIFVVQKLLSPLREKRFYGKSLILICLICFASITPMMQATTTFRAAAINKTIFFDLDRPDVNRTFADKDPIIYCNFMAVDYKDKLFFKYFASSRK